MTNKLEKLVLGGGCFWCIEAVFKNLKGITKVTPGYAGGEKDSPTYEEVSTGKTGYAEVIELEFNPDEISLAEILEIFFASHDPTTLNCQGADVGPQYRSIILYTNNIQKIVIENYLKKLNEKKVFDRPIVTELKVLTKFWPAEDYHHDYFDKNRAAPYCQVIIAPKLKKITKKYADKMRRIA